MHALSPAAVRAAADACVLPQRLGPEDSQFVYDAAAAHTVDIATHRHGCCVLQRCIDFATPGQKRRLIDQIAAQALPLSQVPPAALARRDMLHDQVMGASAGMMQHLQLLCALQDWIGLL